MNAFPLIPFSAEDDYPMDMWDVESASDNAVCAISVQKLLETFRDLPDESEPEQAVSLPVSAPLSSLVLEKKRKRRVHFSDSPRVSVFFTT